MLNLDLLPVTVKNASVLFIYFDEPLLFIPLQSPSAAKRASEKLFITTNERHKQFFF